MDFIFTLYATCFAAAAVLGTCAFKDAQHIFQPLLFLRLL